MKKNVSGQKVGAQMVSATDGSAFTGSVTVAVTGDAGTQATGSVGSGACTHEGNGYHTYAPAQSETNYDLVAFTFTGSGAIPATVQIYTSFPQTGDSYARLGAPAGASVSADIAAIEAQTDDIGAAGAGLTAIPWNSAWDAEVQSEVADALGVYDPPTNAEMVARTLVSSAYATATDLATVDSNVDDILTDTGTTLPATLSTIAGYIDTEVAAIKAVTDNLPDSGALTSLATAANLATVDTVVDAIKAKTDNLPASPAATGDIPASDITAIKAKTDSLAFTVAGQVDANVQSINDVTITGDGQSGTEFGV